MYAQGNSKKLWKDRFMREFPDALTGKFIDFSVLVGGLAVLNLSLDVGVVDKKKKS